MAFLLLLFLSPAAVGGAFAALEVPLPLCTSVLACEEEPPLAMVPLQFIDPV